MRSLILSQCRDMIEVFKILHNYYDSNVAPKLTLNNASITKGNSLKLLNLSFHYDLRKYSFPACVVNDGRSVLNYRPVYDSFTFGTLLIATASQCSFNVIKPNNFTEHAEEN